MVFTFIREKKGNNKHEKINYVVDGSVECCLTAEQLRIYDSY